MNQRQAILCALLLSTPSAAQPKAQPTVQLQGVSETMRKPVQQVIDQQLRLTADTTANAALADDLAFFIRRHYLERGYDHATVSWTLVNGAAVIHIVEAQALNVGNISFTNNPDLNVDELRRYLLRPTRERLGRLAKDTPYVEKEISAGTDLVLRYLLSQGYADATIAVPEPTIRHSTVDLHLTLQPGQQWHIGKVTISGAPDTLLKTLSQHTAPLSGSVANEAKIERSRHHLEGIVQAQGYYLAKATIESSRAAQQLIDLHFTIQPGALHRVTKIEVSPDFSHGGSRLVRSIFRSTVGQSFESIRMEQAYGRIVDTGLFEHLEMIPTVATDRHGELVLTFSGEEAKPASLGVSLGYDTFLGAIAGLEFKHVNFWDSGGTLRARLQGNQLGYGVALGWRNPAILDTPYRLIIDLEPETFTFGGYQRDTAALRTGLARDLGPHSSIEAWILYSINQLSSDTLTTTELGPDAYRLSEAGLTYTYESRDNPIAPKQGWYLRSTLKAGQVSTDTAQLSYLRSDLAASWYQPLTPRWRTAIGLQLASLISKDEVSAIPIELRNYNGGANGVRSFTQRELGPQSDSDRTPLGGTQSQTLSGELCYELLPNLELAGFLDIGSLSTDQGNWLPKTTDLRYAAGLGLRYRLPFGPLRIDYGVNLNRRTGESFGALHIGFGMAF
jgi:outer membrane protein insertion porin family